MLELTPSIPNEWDRRTSIGLASIFCIMIGDFDTARQIWEDHDAAERDRIPATEAQWRFSYGRYLVAINRPGALEQFERAAELAREFDWPNLEHVANSEMAALLATEGRIAAARPMLAAAIQTWVRVGDQPQLWTTLHHVVDVLLKAGQRDLAQELWHELRDRAGYISQTQRAALQSAARRAARAVPDRRPAPGLVSSNSRTPGRHGPVTWPHDVREVGPVAKLD